jgi:hypothetical protein
MLRVGVLLAALRLSWLAATCSVCRDGSPVGDPEKAIALLPPYDVIDTCGKLDTLTSLAITEGSMECDSIEDVSTYCGCAIPQDVCRLCGNNGEERLKDVQGLVDFSMIPDGVVTKTCGIAEAYLHSYSEGDALCVSGKADLETSCGCETGVASDPVVVDRPETTDKDGVCSMCKDGSPLAYPEKNVAHVVEYFLTPELLALLPWNNTSAITCGLLADMAEQFTTADDDVCGEIQYLLAGPCGSPSLAERPCRFCLEKDVPLRYPDRMVYSLEDCWHPRCNLPRHPLVFGARGGGRRLVLFCDIYSTPL